MQEIISVLVVEDDQRIAKLLAQLLRSEGYAVSSVSDGAAAVDAIKASPPDLVILDLMLPKLDGVEVCQAVRPQFQKPILMLTAHEDDIYEVTALKAGVDDYVTKPIRPHILLARMEALLRRTHIITNKLMVAGLEIDHSKRSVMQNGAPIDFSDSEFELLWSLAHRAGQVIPRDMLFQGVRNKDYDGLDRSIDMRISKLRKKLGKHNPEHEYIRTIRNVGYLFIKET
ncbi:MAG: response regulator transcription factor [Bermanella sp.]